MSRFTAELLDLSRLPPPDAIRDFNFETIFAERIARTKELLLARGIPFDVEKLETEPAAIIEEADSDREMLGVASINDAVRDVMLAFATGANLKQIAGNFGVPLIDGESDDRLRRRIQLAPDAYGAAGSEGAYIYWALTADVRVIDAVALGYGSPGLLPGQVNVVIAAPADVAQAALANVQRVLFSSAVKPLTDILTVNLTTPWLYRVKAVIEIPRGPDPAVVKAAAIAALEKYIADRRRSGALIALSGIAAALHLGPVERVRVLSPAADVEPWPNALAVCEAIDIEMKVLP